MSCIFLLLEGCEFSSSKASEIELMNIFKGKVLECEYGIHICICLLNPIALSETFIFLDTRSLS